VKRGRSEPRKLTAVASTGAADPDVWELRLYVAGKTARSVAAFERTSAGCARSTWPVSATFNFAAGWDAIDPKTRASAPDQREYDLTVDARPPWLRPAFLKGWWLRVRGGILEQEGASLGWQVRVILNWERDLL
jgi:hypothetical protein